MGLYLDPLFCFIVLWSVFVTMALQDILRSGTVIPLLAEVSFLSDSRSC